VRKGKPKPGYGLKGLRPFNGRGKHQKIQGVVVTNVNEYAFIAVYFKNPNLIG